MRSLLLCARPSARWYYGEKLRNGAAEQQDPFPDIACRALPTTGRPTQTPPTPPTSSLTHCSSTHIGKVGSVGRTRNGRAEVLEQMSPIPTIQNNLNIIYSIQIKQLQNRGHVIILIQQKFQCWPPSNSCVYNRHELSSCVYCWTICHRVGNDSWLKKQCAFLASAPSCYRNTLYSSNISSKESHPHTLEPCSSSGHPQKGGLKEDIV